MTKRAETKGTTTPSAIVTNGSKFVLGNPHSPLKNQLTHQNCPAAIKCCEQKESERVEKLNGRR